MTPVSPLHLYVHIPYCLHKCPYCDFNSHVRTAPPWERYQQALARELAHWAERPPFAGRTLTSIYFGGGTPSLMPPEYFARFLTHVRHHFPLAPDAEISMEANPGTTEHGSLVDYRAAGVNRLSIGVQSFHDAELQWLERIHTARDAIHAVHAARDAGFDNISVDLMYGLPGQALSGWIASLDTAIRLAPEHLSCYQLTVEPHTGLARRHARRHLPFPDEEASVHFFHATRERLAGAGYDSYEISNFARPGRICRHNDGYWRYHDYIGVGAGACGKWDMPDRGIVRHVGLRRPEDYMEAVARCGTGVAEHETLSRWKAAAEAVWLGLRRRHGIDRKGFQARFGRDVRVMFGPVIALWQQRGYLETTPLYLRLTGKGIMLADAIAADVLALEQAACRASV